jgi:hypothetical protein
MIYLVVATDLVGDGLLIGAATAVMAQLGFVLAAGRCWPTSRKDLPYWPTSEPREWGGRCDC